MVPLVMSTSREDNPNSAFEEFATHLSLYDDSFHFVERSVPSMEDNIKGPLPPSVLCPTTKITDDVPGQIKVKRKCGRPRNPIPRHKRESHINAEHRRRGKIQDGFRTLKSIVPKYEQTSGRDSKADILFKAVDYCKLLQNDIKELGSPVEALRAERDVLALDIKSYKALVPDVCVYEDMPLNMEDRYQDYVQHKAPDSWTFRFFKAIMRPLFESYKLTVSGQSMAEFMCTVADWATSSMSLSSLRTVCLTALRDIPKDAVRDTSPYIPKDAISPYKDGLTLDSAKFRQAGSVAHSLIIDNNSHCLNSQAFTPEPFPCRDGAESVNSSRSVGTANTEMFTNRFNNSHPVSNSSSPVTRMSTQHHQDLTPFGGGNGCRNIFGDLSYNLDHDLHHHHLNLARAGIDGSDPWSPLYLRQQQWQHYHNNHFPPSNYFHDLKKAYTAWDNQHHLLPQYMGGDLTSGPSLYYDKPDSLPDRDLPSPREASDTLSAHVPYLGHTPFVLQQDRHKQPSQSSSDSEGSLLNMETFARQTTDTLGKRDKYGQLSPSTDSCMSPGSGMFVPSPCALNGRSADYAFPYHSTSSLDHLKQHKSRLQERVDSLDSQLAAALPSYRDTFGFRKGEIQRQSVMRLDDEVLRQSASRFDGSLQRQSATRIDGEVRPHWSSNTPRSTPGAGWRQTSCEKLEHANLLAEMLSQQSILHPVQPAHHYGDKSTRSPPCTHTILTSNTLPVKPSAANKGACQFNNGIAISVKQENGYTLPWLPGRPEVENIHPSVSDGSSSPQESQDVQMNFEASISPTNSFGAQTASEVHNPSPSWMQPYPKRMYSPGLGTNETTQLDGHGQTHNQICYFEIAHQQLLKHYSLSPNDSRIRQLQATDLRRSTQASSHNSHTDPAGSGQPLQSSVQTDTILSGQITGQITDLTLPMQTCQTSRDPTPKQKVRRKGSFEDNCPEDHLLQAVSGCKKMCV